MGQLPVTLPRCKVTGPCLSQEQQGTTAGRAQHKAPQSRTASEHSKQKHTQAGDCTACSGRSRRVKDTPSWACRPFQHGLWGRTAWVRRDAAAPGSCTQRLRLRPVPRPCPPAPTPGQQPQPGTDHLEQKARAGQQHEEPLGVSDLVGMGTFWTPSTPAPSAFQSPDRPCSPPASLPAPLPWPPVYRNKTGICHRCLPANSGLEKTLWRKPQVPQSRAQEQAGPDSFLYWGPFSRAGTF